MESEPADVFGIESTPGSALSFTAAGEAARGAAGTAWAICSGETVEGTGSAAWEWTAARARSPARQRENEGTVVVFRKAYPGENVS